MEALEALYGSDTFGIKTMEKYLSKSAFKKMMQTIQMGGKLDMGIADEVAQAMKVWALSKGATHYTHWFQPLSDATAEKHDSFVEPDGKGGMIFEFTGKNLIQAEPDASSFPSGGIRATFEARGYTAWDPTSPAFIKRTANTVTLCIPTAFCSYTGEALDKKTPLLRSMVAVGRQTKRVLECFGLHPSTVDTNLGAEQEYFLIDRDLYIQRPDLIETGRTLFGCLPPKHQQMEDHYFGSIKERVLEFMTSVDHALWALGVPSKTRHNEAAPGQFEICPLFEPCNVAVDHNVMIMDILQRQALKYNLVCLLHEKPYACVNGSGKHDNWSLCTDTGVNLLEPGDTPNENVQFLFILACIMRAVDRHADLLRQSAANVGNDHRLGGDEAPPAIISIFLGEQLEDVVSQLVETGAATHCAEGGKLETGVSTLPEVQKDATDRNRTSPFAFTGNKFEFRSVGSSDSIGSPNTTLNAIVAEAFCEAADILEKADNFEMAVHDLLKKYMTEHQRIIFNGNGYSQEWVEEAARRGLPNIGSMVETVETLTTEKSIALFEKFHIFTKPELEARKEVLYDTYAKTINIEALTMIDMTRKQILPAVVKYTKILADTVIAVKEAGADATVQMELLKEVSDKLAETKNALDALEKAEAAAKGMACPKERAFYYKDSVTPAMNALRAPVDKLEMLVAKEVWPMPSYGDLLFEV